MVKVRVGRYMVLNVWFK